MRLLSVMVVVLLISGCGVDWFPDDSKKTFNNNSSAFVNATSATTLARPDPFIVPDTTVPVIFGNTGQFAPPISIKGRNPAGWTLYLRSLHGVTNAVNISNTANPNGTYITVDLLNENTKVYPGDTLTIEQQIPLTISNYVLTRVVLGTYSTTVKQITGP